MRSIQRTVIGEKKLKRLGVKGASLKTGGSVASNLGSAADAGFGALQKGPRTPMIINKDKLNESMDRRMTLLAISR